MTGHFPSKDCNAPCVFSLEGISFRYGERPVLRDVSLAVGRGEIVGIIGKNGAGKSTLFHLALGLLRPQQGRVLMEGKALRWGRGALREHRTKVNIVFQDPDRAIFYPDVENEVAFALRNLGASADEAKRKAMEALERVGIADLAASSVDALSFGQKKRVSIASVLAMDPEVILFDEPMAGLDPELAERMEYLLRELSGRGRAILIAGHDMESMYRLCNRLYVLSEGRLWGGGDPGSVFEEEERIREAGLRVPLLHHLCRISGLAPDAGEGALLKWMTGHKIEL